MEEKEYKNCFVCGADNPVGLKLDFRYENNLALANWQANKKFEGYDGIIHGGIIASLLDEAVAKIILKNNIIAVTTELNVKYFKPFPSDKEVLITGEITDIRKKIIFGKAKISDKDNPHYVFAEADAKYFIIKQAGGLNE